MAGPGDAMTTSNSSTTTTTTKPRHDNNEKHGPTFTEQLHSFDFRGDAIDMALRKLLAKAHLPKEAQQIDRAMEDFAKRYHECNPDLTDNSDPIYAVAFSLLLLHTDAHNKNVRQKMNKDTFIMRTRIIEGGEDVATEILDVMYDNIVSTEFTYAADGEEDDLFKARTPTTWFGRLARSDSSSALAPANMIEDLYPKLTQLMPPENSFCYKRILKPIQLNDVHMAFHHARPLNLGGVRGRHPANQPQDGNHTYTIRVAKAAILERKYDMLPGGKKATARGWRPFGVILSGTQIIFFADVLTFDSWLLGEEERRERESPRQSHSPGTNTPIATTPPPSQNSRPISERTSSSSSTATNSLTIHSTNNTPTGSPNPFRFPSVSTSTVDSTSHTSSFTSSIYSTHSLTHSIIPSSPSTPTGFNHQNNNLLRPVQIISLADAVCIYDESYTKYPHVFRLMTGDGQLFLLRAKNNADMDDWMTKINYAATIKTTGVRLKSPSSTSSSSSRRHGPRSMAADRMKREEKAKAKILELSRKMVELERLLERDLQLRRNLMVLVPLQKPSKERILYFADMVGKRIYAKRLEMQRLECYREYLEAALADFINQHQQQTSSTMSTRKMSAPLLSRSLIPANILAAHRSATTPAIAHMDNHHPNNRQHYPHHQLPPPRSYTVSPMPFEDDHHDDGGEVMWSQTGRDTPSSSSEMLKPSTSSSEEDEKSVRRSSCPQIPPFPFAMEEVPAGSPSSSSITPDTVPSSSTVATTIATTASSSLEKNKDKSVAFDVPTESDLHHHSKTSKWMRRRSSSNPVKPAATTTSSSSTPTPATLMMINKNRERSSSEASSVRDDDELTIVNVATGTEGEEEDEDDMNKKHGNPNQDDIDEDVKKKDL
ncbi:hypothetical protein BDA99DRAFT_231468 [Phascolomyces articulosus]|uniref:Guanyl-nucleotide exchange factor n=1 Tax=Phascolomyces articulosus TaxID=60185 RepID=A0AAD5JZI0_9FUNG|nr:hypothetical protein BDA99DRAFT_231468 [Phascolomyces articulosus]